MKIVFKINSLRQFTLIIDRFVIVFSHEKQLFSSDYKQQKCVIQARFILQCKLTPTVNTLPTKKSFLTMVIVHHKESTGNNYFKYLKHKNTFVRIRVFSLLMNK